MKDLNLFFSDLSEPDIFADCEHVWDPLKTLESRVKQLIRKKVSGGSYASHLAGIRTTLDSASYHRGEQGFYVEDWVDLAEPIYLKELDIFIGKGTQLEPSAIIKGPAMIGEDCDIRQGAYIRGNALIGNHSVIGHATELKNSILMDHTEAGHFNYIGDSIIGSHVNLGAGSKLANLQLRSADEKRKGYINPIHIPLDSEVLDTGMEKLGAVIGDNVELGCNAIVCPGTLIGKDVWVYPGLTIPKGYYPAGTLLVPKDRKPRSIRK
ncbi:MAG: glucose-1-phosphate thymidylyltransferase [Nitrospina sp.]|jgi:NDP-sugar pyrophosphorylase family protein|nr:glucose-1-phosphate thymidylyltransferase [Nitrospina sp.]MBT3415606.1 glucose-1-phosphate thymidylyltransferase [Nitrospina sp.]MBT3858033.1 glucose-1-phosphate thymidylyltransferase [Nitrospina sp.]MBT4105891.1 glucose-1-phosphate thymidylyltransferase [Nitrospina sp.]MBT4390032.1 glucose-1-phosphate thymidylyltransferase [Nitrospina sp.]